MARIDISDIGRPEWFHALETGTILRSGEGATAIGIMGWGYVRDDVAGLMATDTMASGRAGLLPAGFIFRAAGYRTVRILRDMLVNGNRIISKGEKPFVDLVIEADGAPRCEFNYPLNGPVHRRFIEQRRAASKRRKAAAERFKADPERAASKRRLEAIVAQMKADAQREAARGVK